MKRQRCQYGPPTEAADGPRLFINQDIDWPKEPHSHVSPVP
jgi:hypothetical protein